MKTDTTICLNSKVNGKQPSLEDRIYHMGGGSTSDDNRVSLQHLGDSVRRYLLYQYPRGVNPGGILNVDICPTISCSSWQNNCLLIEVIYESTEDNH